jgi:hypothetical protein
MNLYKYQIVKYLLTQNKDVKTLKKLNKEELLKEIQNIDKKELAKYLNKRKNRTVNKDVISSSEIHKPKIIIEWSNLSLTF